MARHWRKLLAFGFVLAALLGAHQVADRTAWGVRVSHTLWGLNSIYYARMLSRVPSSSQRRMEQKALESIEEIRVRPPDLSRRSGLIEAPFRLESTDPGDGAVIRFSTDGSVPTKRHPRLPGRLRIGTTTVIRAKAFRPGRIASRTVTASYIFERPQSAAVVSVVLDPLFLYDKHSGLIANPFRKGRAWERTAELFIMDLSGELLQAEVPIRIHGGTSRHSPVKNLRIRLGRDTGEMRPWFRSGAERIADIQAEWVLRRTPGPRQSYSDGIIRRVAHRIGLPTSPARPCVVYLNGHPYGPFDLMERISPAFAAGKAEGERFLHEHGMSLVYPEDRPRNPTEWERAYRAIVESDLAAEESLERIEEIIDLDNLISYYVLSIFMADSDRPHGNIDLFRMQDGGRWWFGVWDFDAGFNCLDIYTDHDTLAWHLRSHLRPDLRPSGSPDTHWRVSATALLRALMRNDLFRRRFVARFESLLDSEFTPAALRRTLNAHLAERKDLEKFEQELLVEPDRKGGLFSYDDRMREISDFIHRRAEVVRRHLREQFPNEVSSEK